MAQKNTWDFTTGVTGLPSAAAVSVKTQASAGQAAVHALYVTGIQIRNGANAGTVVLTDSIAGVKWAWTLAANEGIFPDVGEGGIKCFGDITVMGSAAGGGAIVNIQGEIY